MGFDFVDKIKSFFLGVPSVFLKLSMKLWKDLEGETVCSSLFCAERVAFLDFPKADIFNLSEVYS